MPDRPNLLLITADQHRADCFGHRGRKVKTPHLDALAAAGARFDNCITPNAVCQPARASMLTGLFPRTHGVSDNGVDLLPRLGEAGFAGQLSAAGYETAFIGKAHFSSQSAWQPTGYPECHLSSADYAPDWRGPWMGFNHFESVVHSHDLERLLKPPHGLAYEHFFHRDGHGPEKLAAYRTRLAPDVGAHKTWTSALPSAWHSSSWVADRTIAQLRAAGEAPFCIWASFPDPHDPMDCPDPWARMHHPEEVDLPPNRTRDFDRRPWWHQRILNSQPSGPDAGANKRRAFANRSPVQDDDKLRHIIANYYSMISLIDHNVGRMLEALDAYGLADNTLVIYTSDHGDWLGDHGLVNKGPILYESVLRVGMLLKGPGIPAGTVVTQPVATTDLLATLLEAGGTSPQGPTHGRSLLPLLNDAGAGRDFSYSEWDVTPAWCGFDMHFRTVHTRDHKLTLEALSGDGELYDLANDPGEMENRWNDPAYAAVQRELLDMLRSRPDDVMTPPLAPSGNN